MKEIIEFYGVKDGDKLVCNKYIIIFNAWFILQQP